MNKTLIAVLAVIGLAGAGGAAWGKSLPLTGVGALKPGTVFQDCHECPEMVIIPSGDFMMGSPDSESERRDREGPVHRVTIPAVFAAGKYEVTFDEWDACFSAGGCVQKYAWMDEGWGRGRRPVIYVDWISAQKYVSWLSKKTGKTYRLLSEAEWEYVARAGTTTPFHTGETISSSEANFASANRIISTTPVGNYPSNQFGLHDVRGNVNEWVEDCYNESYKGAPSDGSAWTTGNCSRRVLRGGSWALPSGWIRSALRLARQAKRFLGEDFTTGFRVARTLP